MTKNQMPAQENPQTVFHKATSKMPECNFQQLSIFVLKKKNTRTPSFTYINPVMIDCVKLNANILKIYIWETYIYIYTIYSEIQRITRSSIWTNNITNLKLGFIRSSYTISWTDFAPAMMTHKANLFFFFFFCIHSKSDSIHKVILCHKPKPHRLRCRMDFIVESLPSKFNSFDGDGSINM